MSSITRDPRLLRRIVAGMKLAGQHFQVLGYPDDQRVSGCPLFPSPRNERLIEEILLGQYEWAWVQAHAEEYDRSWVQAHAEDHLASLHEEALFLNEARARVRHEVLTPEEVVDRARSKLDQGEGSYDPHAKLPSYEEVFGALEREQESWHAHDNESIVRPEIRFRAVQARRARGTNIPS